MKYEPAGTRLKLLRVFPRPGRLAVGIQFSPNQGGTAVKLYPWSSGRYPCVSSKRRRGRRPTRNRSTDGSLFDQIKRMTGAGGQAGRVSAASSTGVVPPPFGGLSVVPPGKVDVGGGAGSPPLVTPSGMTRFLPWKRTGLNGSASEGVSGAGDRAGNGGVAGKNKDVSAMAFVKKAYGSVNGDKGRLATSNLRKMLPQGRKDIRDQKKIRHAYSLSRQGSMGLTAQDVESCHSVLSSGETRESQQDGLAAAEGEDEEPNVERTVLFNDGSSYSGEWRGSHIEGRGVFMWANGDRFEGEWKHDVQHGQGTYAAADGSMYYGGWKDGVKDGEGVYRSPWGLGKGDAEMPQLFLRRYEDGVLVKEVALDLPHETKGRIRHKLEKHREKHEVARKRKEEVQRPLKPGEVIYKGHHSYDLMRQLQIGIMYGIAQEEAGGLLAAGVDAAGSADEVGQAAAGQPQSSNASEPSMQPDRSSQKPGVLCTLTKRDYSAVVVQSFPSTNSLRAFVYKEYVPKVFRVLRESFGVDSADYLVSITGGPALREMPSPGASGCIFFLSEDDRFFIKSVRKDEMGIVLNFMKHYQRYVFQNPMTLLVKFFGIHRVSPWLGKNARFVVMGNVLPTERRMHRKFDLKGSTYKRTVGKERLQDPDVTLKDLDIDMKFLVSSRNYLKVLATMQNDVNFLASRNLIDYSLLLGVHVISWGERQWYSPEEVLQNGELLHAHMGGHDEGLPGASPTRAGSALGAGRVSSRSLDQKKYHSLAFSRNLVQNVDSLELLDAGESEIVKSAASLIASANSVRDAARTSAASASSSMEFSKKPAALKAAMSRIESTQGLEQGVISFPDADGQTSIGWGMPAISVQVDADGVEHRTPVLLYFGIIDFLQRYNTRKKIEKLWKTTLHGPSVSVADPFHYASRFMTFMKGVFVDIGDQFGDVDGLEFV
jgi:hypothetical protein